MAAKLHKLAALRQLSVGLGKLENQHRERLARGDNPADVDREVAQLALNDLVTFFLDYGMEARPFSRLLIGLTSLSAGSSLPAMFAPTVAGHRRPDAPVIQMIKGRLAAIMEFRQHAGSTREAAGGWVVLHMPPKMRRHLGSVKRATVDTWLVKWGGNRRTTPGSGRDGYLHMRAILAAQRPTEQQLKQILQTLAGWLPS